MTPVKLHIEGSKSLALRYMVMNRVLGCTPRMLNMPQCDDVCNMQSAIEHIYDTHINIGEGAAPLRFFTALAAATPGVDITVEGRGRLPQRPILPLVEALKKCGAQIDYPPLHIKGAKLFANKVDLPANISSQFISAMMMVAPLLSDDFSINIITDKQVSSSYIKLTASVMREYGYNVDSTTHQIRISKGEITNPVNITIESDWSSVAAILPFVLLTGKQVEIPYLQEYPSSVQPDSCVQPIYEKFGLGVCSMENAIISSKDSNQVSNQLKFDANQSPDMVLSLAVFCLVKDIKFEISGISTLKHKESDRAEVLRQEVTKLGYRLEIDNDTLIYKGVQDEVPADIEVVFDSHSDHRIAMAMAQFKTRYPNINISDKQVVNKSYPQFWQDLEQLGVVF